MSCKTLLVALLDSSPLLLEARIVDVFQEALHISISRGFLELQDDAHFKLVKILEELALWNLEGLVDEVTQSWVAL